MYTALSWENHSHIVLDAIKTLDVVSAYIMLRIMLHSGESSGIWQLSQLTAVLHMTEISDQRFRLQIWCLVLYTAVRYGGVFFFLSSAVRPPEHESAQRFCINMTEN